MKWLVWALPVLLMVGCSASGSSGAWAGGSGAGDSYGTGAGGSIGSGSGGSSAGCITDVCLATTPPAWDVQIDPPSSSSYAPKQVLANDVPADGQFTVRPLSTISLTFNGAPHGGTVPAKANVVLNVPPLLPGRPDLSYQAAASANNNGTAATATLALPPDAVGMSANISLAPLPPADVQMPPYSFSATLAISNVLTLAEGDALVSGQVTNAVQGAPNAQFVARAFQSGVLVSNAPLTQLDGTATDGSFQLRVAAAAAASPVTLELRPTTTVPWVVSMPFSIMAGKSLGTISLPAYPPSNGFNIAAVADDTRAPLAGATVRAQTTVGATAGTSGLSASAQYTASGSTDANGNVVLQLLPGSGNVPFKYQVSVVPPAGSPYAITCDSVDVLAVSAPGGTAPPPTLPTSRITRRPELIGVIRTAGGAAVPNVTVTATGTPDPKAGCPAPDPVTASTTSDAKGTYQLPLEPGTYQLDYDPPSGTSAPRMTEWAVMVDSDPGPHDVSLPPGALVKGSVIGPDGAGVPSATVRFFERRCNGQQADCFGPNRTPPWLRGKALTDASGLYRMVVPVPSTP
jgi:hypothetical protein